MWKSDILSRKADSPHELPPEPTLKRAAVPALLVLLVLAGIYLLAGYRQPAFLSGFGRVYILYPIFWFCLALLVAAMSRKSTPGRITYTRRLIWAALLAGAFQVACLAIAALFTSFGYSPYNHTPYYIFLNTSFFVSSLFGMEFARSYLLNSFAGRRSEMIVIPVTLLLAVLSLPMARLTNGDILSVTFVAGTCLPLVGRNLVASYLALVTRGPLASIAYLGILLAFEWYSPILPDPPWILKAFVETLAAVIALLVLQNVHDAGTESTTADVAKKSSLAGWVIVAVVCVAIVFVSFGALGFRPMLVGSGSMSPTLNVGDIVLIRSVSADAVGEGDIIQFVKDGATTIHRVVAVEESESRRVFVTQGDANDSPDSSPVYPQEIQGKVSLTVPKVGWIAVGLKSLFS